MGVSPSHTCKPSTQPYQGLSLGSFVLIFSEKVKVLIRALNGSVAAVDGGFAEYDTFARLKFTSTKSDPECVFRKAYISRIRTNDPVHWIWHPALPKGFPAQFLTSPPGAG